MRCGFCLSADTVTGWDWNRWHSDPAATTILVGKIRLPHRPSCLVGGPLRSHHSPDHIPQAASSRSAGYHPPKVRYEIPWQQIVPPFPIRQHYRGLRLLHSIHLSPSLRQNAWRNKPCFRPHPRFNQHHDCLRLRSYGQHGRPLAYHNMHSPINHRVHTLCFPPLGVLN